MAAPDPDDIDRVWKLIEKIDICMLASKDGEKIRSRPMSAKPRQSAHAIYFLTDSRGHKDEELAQDNHVCLSFAQPSDGKFLTISGRARILNDRALIRDLWDSIAETRWSSPDDPVVRLIEVTPEEAEFWEGPHGIAATFAMVVAAATSGPPVLGEQRKVDLQ